MKKFPSSTCSDCFFYEQIIRKGKRISVRQYFQANIRNGIIYVSCQTETKRTDMKKTGQGSLNMRIIFRCMMEDGYYPTYEKTHILFNIDDNVAVLEYEEDILSVRIFFSIDEDEYDLFLEASNASMLESFIVKPAIMDNMKNIMFSCEMMCGTLREFRKFFPRGIQYLKEAISVHKNQMKRLILAEKVSSATISAAEDIYPNKGTKIVS